MSNLAEKLVIACPQCGEKVAVSRTHIGKKGRCKACQTVFPIVDPDELVPIDTPVAAPKVDDDPYALRDEPSSLPKTAPIEASAPRASMADDYMKRARNDKGTLEQEEDNATYRWMTSYGSVIGGITTIVLGLLLGLIIFSFMRIRTARLLVVCVFIVIAGVGWTVQGANYIMYYRWKDHGGRDPQ